MALKGRSPAPAPHCWHGGVARMTLKTSWPLSPLRHLHNTAQQQRPPASRDTGALGTMRRSRSVGSSSSRLTYGRRRPPARPSSSFSSCPPHFSFEAFSRRRGLCGVAGTVSRGGGGGGLRRRRRKWFRSMGPSRCRRCHVVTESAGWFLAT